MVVASDLVGDDVMIGGFDVTMAIVVNGGELL